MSCFHPDPTLNVKNIKKVMKKVEDWESVGAWLHVPRSKEEEIEMTHQTDEDRSCAIGKYYVCTVHDASWEEISGALYLHEEKGALKVAKNYLQTTQGMQLYLLSDIGFYL